MEWELDPDLALQTRLSLGRHAVKAGCGLLAAMLATVLLFGDRGPVAVAIVAGITLGSLVMALPFAVIHVLTLDGDGRLDQQRLSGRSDARLAAVLLVGASWVLLVFGLPSIVLSRSLASGSGSVYGGIFVSS